MKSVRFLALSTVLFLAPVLDLGACGPYIFSNQELDPLSFVDPLMVDDPNLAPFYLYASAPLGLGYTAVSNSSQIPAQTVIQNSPIGFTSSHITNPVYELSDGENPADLDQANLLEWQGYFKSVFGKSLSPEECRKVVYDFAFPGWLDKNTLDYLTYIKDPGLSIDTLAAKAEDPKTSAFLKTRWAFQAVKLASTMEGGSDGPKVYGRLIKHMVPTALSTARAKGYQARQKSPADALEDYLDIFDRVPALRTQIFLSLMNGITLSDYDDLICNDKKPKNLRASGVFARFLVQGRDFSPQTLEAMTVLEPQGNRGKMMFLKMIEMIEQEGGPAPLLSLLGDPDPKAPKGLYKYLINTALKISTAAPSADKAFWLTGAAYLCLYDGDLGRMEELHRQAMAQKPGNQRTSDFRDLVGLMVDLKKNAGKDLTVDLENRLLITLEKAKSHKGPGENRGLYHSLCVLIAQKYLETGHLDLGSMAFSLISDKGFTNIYNLTGEDWFWSSGYPSNNSHNFLLDVLMNPEELQGWKAKLLNPQGGPLVKHLLTKNPLSPEDLDYLTAYKYLRRSSPTLALPILKDLEKKDFFKGDKFFRNGKSPLPARTFSYSDQISVWDVAHPSNMKKVTLVDLAVKMDQVIMLIQGQKDPKKLMDAAAFFVSLQISGFPLAFSNPPQIINFVNDLELYPYSGTTTESPADDFPLFIPKFNKAWKDRAKTFQEKEYSGLKTAGEILNKILELKADPDQEILAIGILSVIDAPQSSHWKSLAKENRYGKTTLYQQLKTTCEGF